MGSLVSRRVIRERLVTDPVVQVAVRADVAVAAVVGRDRVAAHRVETPAADVLRRRSSHAS